ncbi:MAG: hypothetical protein ACI8Q1_001533 [Parvicella sp.]|jgi:hypothetical protein
MNNILILLISILTIQVSAQMFPINGGWIDSTGNIIECSECDSTMFSETNVARYIKKGKWEFYNSDIRIWYATDYDYLSEFTNGLAVVKIKDSWKVIRLDKSTVADIKCHYAYGFSEGFARFQLGNRFGFVDENGKVVIDAKYYGAFDFSDGLARVYDGNKWGYINAKFEVVIPFDFDYSSNFADNRAVVGKIQKGVEKWAVVDLSGKIIYDWSTDYVFPFSEGKALVRKGSYFNGELKFISTSGSIVLSTGLKDCYSFNDGLACGYYEGKWGFFNDKGMTIVNHKYDWPSSFKLGLALVSENEVNKYINRTGDVIWSEDQ